ncbi:sensor histidine kinase [Azospirillum soli]|uniref:sensor histidine kinase n=1 Tax=Azospirillum soli TaxID=1304799 RepID=UPI001AE2719F|nr:ATP-binding protein [Azospirillum soli]MBP2313585.1 signal transduction histidine kinase [Azospirillum soli]
MRYHRPLILLVLAALLPLVVLSAVLGVAWLRQQQSAMERNAVQQVHRLSALIEHELNAQIDILRTLAQSPLLDGVPDEATFFDYAERVQGELPLWTTIVLSDTEGNRLVDSPKLVAGAPGKVVDMPSLTRAVETRAPAIGSILRGPRGRAAFAIRVPVVRNGAVISVVSAVIMPQAFRNLLLDGALPVGWIGAVVDSEGRLVARSSGSSDLIGQPASDSALAARARGGGGVYEGASLEGTPTVTAYQVLPEHGWSVHVAIPRTLYIAPLRDALWLVGAGVLLSLTLAGTFLWLLIRELRLRRLEEAAREESIRLEALGRMTGGVAHDFNNLLGIVMSGAEIIKRKPQDQERVVRYAEAILTAVTRGQSLTRQLAAFGRRSAHEPVRFRLQDRAADLAALLKRTTDSNIDISLTVPDSLWPIHADPNAMEIALINLAVNARDAMPEGGSLSITAENRSLLERRGDGIGLTGDYVALVVRDTGTGIPAEHLGHIFEPFYTTKPADKGTGLGLSQVFGFAKQSGGTLTVTSTVGVGTTFTLYLPRATGHLGTAGRQDGDAKTAAAEA